MMSRNALITGANSGIGLACATRLASDGYKVITVDRDGGCDYTVDVADPDQVRALAEKVDEISVLVNSIAPAMISTPMNAETSPAVLEQLVSLSPMKRLGQSDEVASLVSWLASEECSFSTGATYDISGGRATY